MIINSDMTTELYELLQNLCVSSDLAHREEEFAAIVELTESTSPFLYSYLFDSLGALKRAIGKQSLPEIEKLVDVIEIRLSFYAHWEQGCNRTIELINKGFIKPNEIKPFVRFDELSYEAFYANQNKVLEEKLKHKVFVDNSNQTYVPIELSKNINHVFRKTYAVNVIETLIGIFNVLGVESGRWLDVGCGVGYISNAVNQNLFSSNNWKIQGCDLQQSRVAFAKKNAAKNKFYTCENAFSCIEKLNEKGEKTNIVSMFEFCEHFADPANLIERVCGLSVDAVVIGTPLEQKLDAPFNKMPDPVHLWGFTRRSMEQFFKSTGLEILLSTENKVGYYNQGLDWLTIIAVTPEIKDQIDANFIPNYRK